MAAITICSDFGAPKIKSATVSTVSPSISYEVMGPDAMIFVFWMLSFKPTFSLSSFSFNISPSNEHPGLISFRIDWLDLLAVQGTLKSLLQHHSSKASILHCSAFFTVQLSHPYMTTGKTIALTRWTFVGKVISLLFNMLSSGFEPLWGTISHQSEWLRSKNLQIINAGEGVEKREPSYTVGGNAN